MGVGFSHLLGIAVEPTIHRSRCRHRRSAWRCERRRERSGPTVLAIRGQRLAPGHDDLGDAWGRCGRGGAGASAPCGAPGGSRCEGALPPCVEPALRAGQVPAEVLAGVAGQVSGEGSLSALCVHGRHGGRLWSRLPGLGRGLCGREGMVPSSRGRLQGAVLGRGQRRRGPGGGPLPLVGPPGLHRPTRTRAVSGRCHGPAPAVEAHGSHAAAATAPRSPRCSARGTAEGSRRHDARARRAAPRWGQPGAGHPGGPPGPCPGRVGRHAPRDDQRPERSSPPPPHGASQRPGHGPRAHRR